VVRADNKLLDRQTHLLCHPTREDVAEIATGHSEGHGLIGRTEGQRCPEVVDNLRRDARPVDRVDRRQSHVGPEDRVIEHGFDQRLAIIWRRCTSLTRPWGCNM